MMTEFSFLGKLCFLKNYEQIEIFQMNFKVFERYLESS